MGRTSFDWNRLKIFHAVAEAGSFTEAGRRLHLSQSAVSRQVAALEENFGLMLFQRHARGLALTEAGRNLFEVADDLQSRLRTAAALIKETKDSPSGLLHVTTTMGFGALWLTGALRDFMEQYPAIQIQVSIEEYGQDISKAKSDVGILPHPPDDPGLIQRQLLNYHFYLFASDSYVKKYGEPKEIADLENHRLIGFRSEGVYPYSQINWHLTTQRDDKSPRQSVYESNNLIALAEAAQCGIGIAYLPSYFQRAFPKLRRVVAKTEGPVLPAYFVYPESLKNSKRVKILKDYLIERVKAEDFT